MRRGLLLAFIPMLCVCPLRAGPPIGFPYVQCFDSANPPALPVGWSSSQQRNAGQNDFVTAASSPLSFPNAVLSTNATIEQFVVSPPFDFRGFNPDRLSFYVRRSTSHHARLVVEASCDSGRSYTVALGDTLTNTGQTSYALSSFALPGSLGYYGNVVFRWRVIPDVVGATGTLRIDDVSVTVKNAVDLAMLDLRTFPAHPTGKDTVSVVATVKNVGMRPEQGFMLDVFLDANGDSIPQAGERFASLQSTLLLEADDSAELVLPLGVLPAGEQLLIGELVYPADQNLSNNRGLAKVVVGASQGAIVINEIQYAPASDEPEWVEVYNTTVSAINLKNWSMSDINTSIRHKIRATDLFVLPDGYAVLTKDSAALMQARSVGVSPVVTVPGFPSLNNTGDAVVVFDVDGSPVDSVVYQPAWGGEAGRTLERIDPATSSADPTNWATSQDSAGGTPGRQNSTAALEFDLRVLHASATFVAIDSVIEVQASVQNAGKRQSGPFRLLLYDDANRDSLGAPSELLQAASVTQSLQYRESLEVVIRWRKPSPGVHQVITVVDEPQDLRRSNNYCICSAAVPCEVRAMIINEIMFAPLAGNAEYVELMNCGRSDINMADWKLLDRSSSGGIPHSVTAAHEDRIVHPGELFVVASDSALIRMFTYLRATEPRLLSVVGQGSLNLSNEADDVVLKDASDGSIDSVAYSAAWHNPGVSDPTGRSLERIRPPGGSNDPRNWSTCASPLGGTPGTQNSIYAPTVPANARMTVSPNPFSPDGDGWEDFSVIQYQVPLEVSMISVRIFDVKGRLIRRLANNEPSGAQGSLIWDGRDDDRQKARIGPYIILLEALSERGGVLESAKGIVVLAARL